MDPLSVAVGIIGLGGAIALTTATSFIGLSNVLLGGSNGLCVVSDDENAEVDIVFVHGLGGDPQETWSTRDKKVPKVNWMTDLLPDDLRHTSARILTFGYSQHLFPIPNYGFLRRLKNPSTLDARIVKYLPQTLYLKSKDLMEALTKIRGNGARDRPLIFVAHSLGGLIVKSTLVQASADIGENSRHKAIQLCTTGVLFFGTPQRETSRKPWSELLTRIVTASLEPTTNFHGESITAQAELFDLQVQRYKSIEMNFQNYAFFESKMTQVQERPEKRSSKLYVVPEESVLPIDAERQWWRKIRLEQDHENMVKFRRSDDDYKIVLGCIKECISHSEVAAARSSEFYRKLGVSYSSTTSGNKQRHEEPIAQLEDLDVQSSIVTIRSWGEEQRNQAAGASLKKALLRSEKENGLSSPSTLELINQLALYYVEKEEYSKAEQLYKRVFVSTQDLRGPWHRKTAAILQRIANVEIEQGHLAEATEYLRRVAAIQDAILRRGDPQTLSTRASLAILYDKQKQWQEAESLYAQVIKEREQYLDIYHEDTLMVMENLALSYQMRGKRTLTKAAAQYKLVLDRRKEILKRGGGEDEKERGKTTARKLARIYTEMGALSALQRLQDDWSTDFRREGDDEELKKSEE